MNDAVLSMCERKRDKESKGERDPKYVAYERLQVLCEPLVIGRIARGVHNVVFFEVAF